MSERKVIGYLFNNRNQNQNIQDLADSRFQSKVISYASMIDEIYKSAQLKDIIFGENGIGFQKQDNYSITNTTLLKKNNVELIGMALSEQQLTDVKQGCFIGDDISLFYISPI